MRIFVKSNADTVLGALVNKLNTFESGAPACSELLQNVAANILPQMRNRIHGNGLAADGSSIGVRAKQNGYLVSSGKLRDSFGVQFTGSGYGLGWVDSKESEIATSIEKRYGKKIWSVADGEKQTMITTASEYLRKAFAK